jgi:hypothetical protein
MGLGQFPVYVVYEVSLVSVLVSVLLSPFLSLVDMGLGQLPVATAVPELSAREPADSTAGAAAENARAPARRAAVTNFLNMLVPQYESDSLQSQHCPC